MSLTHTILRGRYSIHLITKDVPISMVSIKSEVVRKIDVDGMKIPVRRK
jgi:hypothetical protein